MCVTQPAAIHTPQSLEAAEEKKLVALGVADERHLGHRGVGAPLFDDAPTAGTSCQPEADPAKPVQLGGFSDRRLLRRDSSSCETLSNPYLDVAPRETEEDELGRELQGKPNLLWG